LVSLSLSPHTRTDPRSGTRNRGTVGAAPDAQEDQDGSSDDEIFRVAANPRHVAEDESKPTAAGQGSAADGEAGGGGDGGGGKELVYEKPRVSKRSMKKIKINGGNGTRMVFDEDTGEALNPLVQLMKSGLGDEFVEVGCVRGGVTCVWRCC
jgi:hypothetical protein